MAAIQRTSFPVPAAAIDASGHVNNIAYIEWMQEIAIEHSTSVGWSAARCIEIGSAPFGST